MTKPYSLCVLILGVCGAMTTFAQPLPAQQSAPGFSLSLFDIRTSTGPVTIPGSYLIDVHCDGPFTTTSQTMVAFPNPGVRHYGTVVDDVCTLTEIQPAGNWDPPIFSVTGGGATVISTTPWSAKIGPFHTAGAIVTIANQPKLVHFDVQKVTVDQVIAGQYNFALACTGPIPLNTTVSVTLPGAGITTANVPLGDTCVMTETRPQGNWDAPVFVAAGGLAVTPGVPWSAAIGPLNTSGGVVRVANQPKPIPMVRFDVMKSTGPNVVAGSYAFTVTCTGPAGPYTGQATITLPGSGTATFTVPSGDTCTLTEARPAGDWAAPTFAAGSLTLTPGPDWSTRISPITASGGVVKVVNTRR